MVSLSLLNSPRLCLCDLQEEGLPLCLLSKTTMYSVYMGQRSPVVKSVLFFLPPCSHSHSCAPAVRNLYKDTKEDE